MILYKYFTVLNSEGLFRLSPNLKEMNGLKAAYDKGLNVAIKQSDPHVIAGLMKLWLRELPDSIIPSKQIAVQFAHQCSSLFFFFFKCVSRLFL